MSSSFFDDILGRAEKLSSLNQRENGSDVVHKGMGVSGQNNIIQSVSVDENINWDLNNVFRASEKLWNQSRSGELKKAVLFGEKGVVFGVRAPDLEETVNVETTANDECELEVDVARVRLESERAFFNHVLLSRPQQTIDTASKMQKENAGSVVHTGVIESAATRRQRIFGDKIRKYIKSTKKKDLGELLKSVNSDPATDSNLIDLWSQAVTMINRKMPAMRDDPVTCGFFVYNACDYLHKQYITHMTEQVERNLEIAQRGGVPGTKGLVEAYLKLGVDDADAEDGVVNGLPVWEMTYHCFRAGDVGAVADVLSHLRSFPQSACLVQSLMHLSKQEKLDSEMKKRLRVEWRHCLAVTRDKYKRALYAALLGTESDLADSMENWLWFQLIVLKIDSQITTALYSEVQKTISIDYGESYFMRSGDYQFYFTALWLSGQFERAIELLANSGQLLEAVHLGIFTHEMGFLRNAPDSSSELLTVDVNHPTRCCLNLPRLIVSFTKEFELAEPFRAMDYFFLAKGFKTPSGADVFEKAVSRTIYLMDNRESVEQILGTLLPNGQQTPGLIDEYVNDATPVIESVAFDTEIEGNSLDAVRLYLLCARPTKAVTLLANEISAALRGKSSDAHDLRNFAKENENLLSKADANEFATLATLLDLAVVFDACVQGNPAQAYKWSNFLRLIPSDPSVVPIFMSEFHMIPETVREVLPDLCLVLMKCMVEALQECHEAKYINQVRAIIMYTSVVDHKFPQHITCQLLKMQASIAL